MRFELYSLVCQSCAARNAPDRKTCVGCGGEVRPIRRCPGCQTENPPNAYICVKCYRKLKTNPPTSFVHFHIPWPASVLVICLSLGWFGVNLFKGWIDFVSTQVELRTQEERALVFQKKQFENRRARVAQATDQNAVPQEVLDEI